MISELLSRCFDQTQFELALNMATAYAAEIETPMTPCERNDFIIGFQLGMISVKVKLDSREMGGRAINALDKTIWNLELLAACPYCGENPCDHDCITWKDSDDLTHQELQDRESLKIARIALENARRIKREKV